MSALAEQCTVTTIFGQTQELTNIRRPIERHAQKGTPKGFPDAARRRSSTIIIIVRPSKAA